MLVGSIEGKEGSKIDIDGKPPDHGRRLRNIE